jgi:small subunit ribosomal protein S1
MSGELDPSTDSMARQEPLAEPSDVAPGTGGELTSNGALELSEQKTGPATAEAQASGGPPVASAGQQPNGAGSAGEAAQAEAESQVEAEAEPQAQPESQQAAGTDVARTEAASEKKKRRRRRKKKPPGATQKTRSRRSSERHPFHQGEEVFGKVTAVLETAIMVDLSGKALAVFDRGEMEPDDLVPEVSDRFVARVHNDGSRGGLVVLTRKPLREEETKVRVEQAARDNTLIGALVTGVIKGGVEVDIDGLRAFAPASGVDLHPGTANLSALLGQRLEFKVAQYEKAGRDVVVTRRPMLEAEAHERRKQALALLQEGQELEGVVRTVVDWGAFVAMPAVENLEGLVHVSELSHDPRARAAEAVKAGDRFPVKILKIDEKGKIWLSRKALLEDPWGEAKAKYRQGSRHTARVTRVERFGVVVELEPDVEGIVFSADLSFERLENIEERVKPGDEMAVVVHNFDYKNRKIVLHPTPEGERAGEAPQRVVRNGHVRAEVIKAESAGLVVRLLGVTGRAARGFVPAGQTGTPRGTDLRKKFKQGTVLDLKVLDVDPKRGESRLSIRGFSQDEERNAHREYRKKLQEEGNFGTLGDLFRARLNVPPTKPSD